MCDQDHYDDDLKDYKERAALSRREFGALGLGAGIAFVLQRPANAVAVTESEVKIKTPDGTCDAYFVAPASGEGAAVIMFPDIVGLRPAFRQMGKRLAESGYAVLVPNPFYRTKAAPVVPDGSKFSDPAVRSQLMPLAGSLNATTVVTDVTAFLAWLDMQKSVDTPQEGRHHGLLHERFVHHSRRRGAAESRRRRRVIPRRRADHQGQQPARTCCCRRPRRRSCLRLPTMTTSAIRNRKTFFARLRMPRRRMRRSKCIRPRMAGAHPTARLRQGAGRESVAPLLAIFGKALA